MGSTLRCMISAAILFTLAGCDIFPFDHVLEIMCVQDTRFNNEHLCLKPDRPGAELAFRVNQTLRRCSLRLLKTMEIGGLGLRTCC
jgi:hypothetical protein